jgi:UDP-N-acetyl-D-mannosaminuronic acid transferase (WecB/TagA/CpsF family)
MIATTQVLGIQFFNGDVDEAVQSMVGSGGFLIAPSGTCFARLREDEPYRRAILAADLAIADSGLMVLLCRLFRGESLPRISGLKYLKHLLVTLKGTGTGRIFWILPSERARQKLLEWSRREELPITGDDCYVAPRYGFEVGDPSLVSLINRRRPEQVITAIGSGPQEKLGHYLRDNLSYRPAIHCIGAALSFLTGDQITIPDWADRIYLGWLLRLMTQPHRFVPRLIRGFELPWLIARYGKALPPFRSKNQNSRSGR